MSRRFMIGSLVAAGFSHPDPLQASLTRATSTGSDDPNTLFQVFRQDHLYTLAGHASHSSHSSHASHSSGSGGHYSHYSSTGGYSPPPTYSPAPLYTPPVAPPPEPSPAPPSTVPSGAEPLKDIFGTPNTPASGLKPLPGRSALFKTVVMKVKVALMGRGLFDGPINGTVDTKLRESLRRFQELQGLTVTGTITPQTLDALHVPT